MASKSNQKRCNGKFHTFTKLEKMNGLKKSFELNHEVYACNVNFTHLVCTKLVGNMNEAKNLS